MKEFIIEVKDTGMVSKVKEEIVRCKDCVQHQTDLCPMEDGMNNPTPDNWFCADGERGDSKE